MRNENLMAGATFGLFLGDTFSIKELIFGLLIIIGFILTVAKKNNEEILLTGRK